MNRSVCDQSKRILADGVAPSTMKEGGKPYDRSSDETADPDWMHSHIV